MKFLKQVKAKRLARPDIKAGYHALADEFAIAHELIAVAVKEDVACTFTRPRAAGSPLPLRLAG